MCPNLPDVRIYRLYHLRVDHECEGGIGKSILRITDWHHEAWRVMKNSDHEGQIFLSNPHTNNGFFFLLTTKYLILYWKNIKKTSTKPWMCGDATWWRNFNILMTPQSDMRPACGRRAAVRYLSFPRVGTGTRSGMQENSVLTLYMSGNFACSFDVCFLCNSFSKYFFQEYR